VNLADEQLSSELPLARETLFVLPQAEFELSKELVVQNAGKQVIESTPAAAVYDGALVLIAEALRLVDYSEATTTARNAFIERYDPLLAAKMKISADLSAQEKQKLAYIKEFERAEWKMIGLRDRDLLKKSYHGQWGAFMRDAIISRNPRIPLKSGVLR
jgi:hypothetical protein